LGAAGPLGRQAGGVLMPDHCAQCGLSLAVSVPVGSTGLCGEVCRDAYFGRNLWLKSLDAIQATIPTETPAVTPPGLKPRGAA